MSTMLSKFKTYKCEKKSFAIYKFCNKIYCNVFNFSRYHRNTHEIKKQFQSFITHFIVKCSNKLNEYIRHVKSLLNLKISMSNKNSFYFSQISFFNIEIIQFRSSIFSSHHETCHKNFIKFRKLSVQINVCFKRMNFQNNNNSRRFNVVFKLSNHENRKRKRSITFFDRINKTRSKSQILLYFIKRSTKILNQILVMNWISIFFKKTFDDYYNKFMTQNVLKVVYKNICVLMSTNWNKLKFSNLSKLLTHINYFFLFRIVFDIVFSIISFFTFVQMFDFRFDFETIAI